MHTAILRFYIHKPVIADIIFFTLLLFLGLGAALVAYGPALDGPAPAVESIWVNDVEIPTGEEHVDDLVAIARERMQAEVTLTGFSDSVTLSWSQLGVSTELEMLKALLVELAVEDSPAAQYFRDHGSDKIELKLPFSLDGVEAVENLVLLKEKYDQQPREARFDFVDNAVVPEVDGVQLDVYDSLTFLQQALNAKQSEVELSVKKVAAKTTADELLDIDVSEVAGFFSTPYSRMRKDADRTYNVTLGASILDGTVIMPGEEFSFNETVGDRSEVRGFRYAPVIAGGKIVEGMGGGTCQVASTLYAAAFFAGMMATDRVPHSRPSSYIKLGLDATVSYPSKDLKLKNPFDYPVVIHFTVEGGDARVEIRAKERPFSVTLLRKVVGKYDYPVKIVMDDKVPKGQDVITQRGVPGYKVQRYRVIERNKVAYRFQSYDRYPPTVEFVHRGTGSAAQLKADGVTPPKADTHKPYRASSSLRMVQGTGIWYEKNHE